MDTRVKSALTLAILAAVLTALVALIAGVTRERIASNEQAWIRQRLEQNVNRPEPARRPVRTDARVDRERG